MQSELHFLLLIDLLKEYKSINHKPYYMKKNIHLKLLLVQLGFHLEFITGKLNL